MRDIQSEKLNVIKYENTVRIKSLQLPWVFLFS